MFQEIILVALIIVIVPLCAILIVRGMAKKKRQRRPVQFFRPN